MTKSFNFVAALAALAVVAFTPAAGYTQTTQQKAQQAAAQAAQQKAQQQAAQLRAQQQAQLAAAQAQLKALQAQQQAASQTQAAQQRAQQQAQAAQQAATQAAQQRAQQQAASQAQAAQQAAQLRAQQAQLGADQAKLQTLQAQQAAQQKAQQQATAQAQAAQQAAQQRAQQQAQLAADQARLQALQAQQAAQQKAQQVAAQSQAAQQAAQLRAQQQAQLAADQAKLQALQAQQAALVRSNTSGGVTTPAVAGANTPTNPKSQVAVSPSIQTGAQKIAVTPVLPAANGSATKIANSTPATNSPEPSGTSKSNQPPTAVAPPLSTGADVWKLPPLQRGVVIEKTALGRAPNLSSSVHNYPVIDDFTNNIATSIKSIDLTAKSYANVSQLKSKIRSYARTLDQFEGDQTTRVAGEGAIAGKELLIAVPKGVATAVQKAAITEVTAELSGELPGVGIKIVEVGGTGAVPVVGQILAVAQMIFTPSKAISK